MKTYRLLGYAGTGKTTLITNLIHYLVLKNYVKSIAFAAPTNKAVNVIKSKFKDNIDDLIEKKSHHASKSDNFNDQIDKLEDIGFKINFLTIHKLLNYKNDFDVDGTRIFVRDSAKSLLPNYDLILIDECSMIPLQIITNIFEEIDSYVKANVSMSNIIKKVPKILFVGDPAQLPPVNEKVSIIFAKDDKDFNIETFKKCVPNNRGYFAKEVDKILLDRFDNLKKHILNQKFSQLEKIVRSDDMNVIGLCNEVRSWVMNQTATPRIGMFRGKKVMIYKYEKDKHSNKINSEWFKGYLNYMKNIEKENCSNIILTWTNKQSFQYNNCVRKNLFNKKKLAKFEIGDILILNDFYNIRESDLIGPEEKNHIKKDKIIQKFYTSEQIKVIDIEEVVKVIPYFPQNLPKRLNKMKHFDHLNNKYQKIVKTVNNGILRKYNVWKLYVNKLNEIKVNAIPKMYEVYVIKDDFVEKLKRDIGLVSNKISELRKYFSNYHKERLKTLDKDIIKPLWKEHTRRFIDPFANVSYGASVTVHKSQGSTFYNVFVDADDIFKNNNPNEAKRCVYTALTRASNEVHILI